MNALLSLTLKGSAIGALLLAVTAVGCSDTKDDDDNTAGKGGTKSEAGESNADKGGEKNTTEGGSDGGGKGGTGGTTGGGGADTGVGGDESPGVGGDHTGAGGERLTGGGGEPASGGAPAIEFGEGGSGSGGEGEGVFVGTGPAEGKFCNTLSFGDENETDDTTFILEVGTGSSKVTFTAVTGECVPADGLACTVLPEGANIPIVLRDASDPSTAIDTTKADILEGEDWIFWNVVDNGAPITNGFAIDQSKFECKDVKYENLP